MALSQRRPIESFQDIPHRQPFTLPHAAHIPREQRRRLLLLSNMLKKRHLGPKRNIVSRLILAHRIPPLLRRLRSPLRCWRRVCRHEFGPALQGRLGYELRGDAAVGETLGFRFGEEAASHGHASDTFQAGEWHFGGLGDGGEGDAGAAGWWREMGEDVEVEEPAKTCEVLVLERM